jgi:hypothetical protein
MVKTHRETTVFSLAFSSLITTTIMSDKSICIICLDDLNWHESEIVSLECGHVFDNIW